MKVWPIITLGALLYGSSFSDGMGVPRGNKPPPRHHASEFDPDDFVAPNQPHRVATMAFREIFAKLMAEQTEWTAPDSKTTIATDDTDDGEDPGKKLFWTTVFGKTDGVPFPGWNDPNPIDDPGIVSQPYTGPGWPNLVLITTEEDPTAPRGESEASLRSTHILTLQEQIPRGIQIALNAIVSGGAVIPCAAPLVRGLCLVPCTAATACDSGSTTGLVVGPIFSGGGLRAGGVPEPSTWVMIFIGALGLIGLRKRKNRLSI